MEEHKRKWLPEKNIQRVVSLCFHTYSYTGYKLCDVSGFVCLRKWANFTKIQIYFPLQDCLQFWTLEELNFLKAQTPHPKKKEVILVKLTHTSLIVWHAVKVYVQDFLLLILITYLRLLFPLKWRSVTLKTLNYVFCNYLNHSTVIEKKLFYSDVWLH